MKVISMKEDCVAAALIAAVLSVTAVVAWGNYKFSQLESVVVGKGANVAAGGAGALDTVKVGVKEGMKEFLQEAAAKSGSKARQNDAADSPVKAPPVLETDHALGKADAPVTMVVYTDIECPYCRRFHETTLSTLRAKYPADLKVVYRHMPLPFHAPAAVNEAVMAECVAKAGGADAFYAFMDAAFAATGGNGKGFGAGVPRTIEALVSQAKPCIDQQQTLPLVEASARSAEELGVTGTPTIFLMRSGAESAFVFKGAAPAEMLSQRIEQLKGVTKG